MLLNLLLSKEKIKSFLVSITCYKFLKIAFVINGLILAQISICLLTLIGKTSPFHHGRGFLDLCYLSCLLAF